MELLYCKPVILLLTLFRPGVFAQGPITVETSSGTIFGQLSEADSRPGFFPSRTDGPGNEAYEFLGIPYAEPPTGPNRFRPPVPIQPWNNLSATVYPPACMQSETTLSTLLRDSKNSTTNEVLVERLRAEYGMLSSEDCLYLNIYTPIRNSTELVPVMMFVHGGNFISGTGSMYKGANLANASDVIVVTINYRLGAFGFLTDGTDNLPGNYGLLDQRMALEWVRNNIEPFGGDAERITVFGEGAGASAVHVHALSPESNTLFRRAIIQSAQYNDELWSLQRAVDQSQAFFRLVNQSDLRANDTGLQLSIASTRVGEWHPHNDSLFLDFYPHYVMAQENYTTRLDVLVGSNDQAVIADSTIDVLTASMIENAFPEWYGQITLELVDRMSRAYTQFYGGQVTFVDGLTPGEELVAASMLETDQMYSTWATEISVQNSRHNCDNCSVYQYRFSGPLSAELTYIFGYSQDQQLNDLMMTFWSNFAKTGNPNNPVISMSQWPAYDASDATACPVRENLGIGIASTSPDDVTSRTFDFWNLYYDAMGFACPLPSNETTISGGDDVTSSDVCEPNVGETLGVTMSNELAGILLIVFIVLTGVFLIAFIVATVCYCKTKKKLKKEKKKNKDEGHDNPVANAYKL